MEKPQINRSRTSFQTPNRLLYPQHRDGMYSVNWDTGKSEKISGWVLVNKEGKISYREGHILFQGIKNPVVFETEMEAQKEADYINSLG